MSTDPRDGRAGTDPGASPSSADAAARRRRPRLVVAVVAGALVLAAAVVGGAVGLDGRGDPQAGPTPAPVATVTASPTSDPAPSPSAGAGVEPTASPAPAPTPEATPGPTPGPTPPPPVPPADAPPATPPQAADIRHGSEVWAVYVLVTPTYDGPGWAEAGARVESLGYTPSGGELACDTGAAEALGLDPQLIGRGVYFGSQADAQRFADLYGAGDVVGIARVTLLCLD